MLARNILSLLLLLGSAVAAAQESAPPESAERAASAEQSGLRVTKGRSGFFARLPPRPELTPEKRKEHIDQLRADYGRAPVEWPKPTIDAGVEWKELGLLPGLSVATDATKAKIALGKQLFFDPRLSGSGQLACASCHEPELAWGDGRGTSFGHSRKPLKRNAPSIMNAGLAGALFWDGRAGSLKDQARAVLLNPDEMHSSEESSKTNLSAVPYYRKAFRDVFGDESITIDRICDALAAFEQTIVGGRSRFDAFLKGEQDALSDSALAGLHLFRTDARCLNCHHGPALSDGKFHNLGLSYYGRKYQDLGRYEVTKQASDVGRFKTPSLRNVAATRPYMHNGLFELPGVLNLYNAGMPTLMPKEDQQDDPLFPREKSPHLKPLGLNAQDLADLLAFLESLTEPRQRVEPPDLPDLHSPAEAQATD